MSHAVRREKLQEMDGREISQTMLGQNQCVEGILLVNSTTQQLNSDLFCYTHHLDCLCR